MGHAHAVGFDQQVIGQVQPQIDVLKPGQQRRPFGLGKALAPGPERVEAGILPARLEQLGSLRGREDLLPAVVTFERG